MPAATRRYLSVPADPRGSLWSTYGAPRTYAEYPRSPEEPPVVPTEPRGVYLQPLIGICQYLWTPAEYPQSPAVPGGVPEEPRRVLAVICGY